jgi:hypothetical protein
LIVSCCFLLLEPPPQLKSILATKGKRECGKAANANEQHDANIETPLDKSYYPLTLTPQQDEDWYTIVKNNIGS